MPWIHREGIIDGKCVSILEDYVQITLVAEGAGDLVHVRLMGGKMHKQFLLVIFIIETF
jgi:hypothetical protein